MNSVLRLELKSLLSNRFLEGKQLESRYSHIWKMDEGLDAIAVALPETTIEVSNILKLSNSHNQKVVVFGGLTNLVGSTFVTKEDLVLSLERMNNIIEIDTSSRTISVECGAIVEEIQSVAEENGLLFPLNFGAKGSAQIGGAISTNAGGLRVIKYGMTRSLVLGLEVVLMDGTIINSMKKIVKDNSGYDLKQLFIGAEGTLGVVTKAVLKLAERPSSRLSAFVGINDYNNVVQFLKNADKALSGLLSGYELIWPNFMDLATNKHSGKKDPFQDRFPYYVLVEILGDDRVDDLNKLEQVIAANIEADIIEDAYIASNEHDLQWFWNIREDVHAIVSQMKCDQHFDISIPIGSIGDTVNTILVELDKLPDVEKVVCFGHVADGNIHFIVGKNSLNEGLTKSINEVIYKPLKSLGGSVSAEHGIGFDKKSYLLTSRTNEEIALMKMLKRQLDPKNLLNTNRIFDLN